ncbi:MAG TPA: nicotinate-nicotinamide nucleotide adenylyltransferase, partial [Gemmatimonadales bacterium]|nr:nicotinate-nicotinamide nucleotide adenylyltransferase [Gemmatimonadales bacterium]
MPIGLLGGSFDPVHNGHLIAAQLAREALELDLVLMLPAARQPLKPGHGAQAADRLRMLELAVDGLEGVTADGREIGRGDVSYTVDTLEELARERPGAGLVLLLGSDAAA